MKFKVGQEVKIRDDLVYNRHYGLMNVTERMVKVKGQKGVIEKVGKVDYIILGQPFWTDEMIEGEYQTIIE